MKLLIRLQGGFGLGDVVFFTVILKHLRKYRPEWTIYVLSPRGMHSSLHGLCAGSFHCDEPDPPYDAEMNLELHEVYTPFPDRPSSKVTHLLATSFGIDYDPSLGRYEIQVSEQAQARVGRWLRKVAKTREDGKFRAVVLHYQGGSSPARKNIEHWQAEQIIDAVRQADRVPILLDWHQSPLKEVRPTDETWGGFGLGDAECMAALIGQCEAFVGIDSGPGKVASATDTPSLILWTKNHPLRYHDPAPNTTHLVPTGHEKSGPIAGDVDRWMYFCRAYNHRTYGGPHDMVGEACWWLMQALEIDEWIDPGVAFVVPPGEEQARWALAKIPALTGHWRKVRVIVSADRAAENRTPGVSLFRAAGYPVKTLPIPVHMGPDRPTDTRGRTLYVSDGYRDGYHFLCPDSVLQLGKPLAEWLPDVPVESLEEST